MTTTRLAGRRPLYEAAKSVGRTLASAREARGLSQESVALSAGIAVVTLSNLERGVSSSGMPSNPTLATMLRLFEVLDIEVATTIATQAML